MELIEKKKLWDEINEIGGCDAEDEWSKGWDSAITEALHIVEEQPKIDVVNTNVSNKWIPVTERLPEQREDVIMNAFWHENWQPLLGWYSNMNDIWHYEFGGCDHHVQVNAWMPLPEPYIPVGLEDPE